MSVHHRRIDGGTAEHDQDWIERRPSKRTADD
jgi:hypothetical protein